uniref:hypothetical protein n=1 Tax=Photorhabdus temperata TaxID=574560 RepID=UPI000587D260
FEINGGIDLTDQMIFRHQLVKRERFWRESLERGGVLTWRQAPLSERNLIKTKCRIKNQHFVNNLALLREGFFFCTPKGQLQRFTLVHACHTLCSLSALAGYNGSWLKTAITLPLGRKPPPGFLSHNQRREA